MPKQFCEKCGKETEHKEFIKQKPSAYGPGKKEQFKAFVDGLVSGYGGGGLAAIELIDRYVVCEACGHKKLENFGDEFK
ncbi:hypothetical protein CEK28_03380 [Xenophilus sp. AP218F]|nr:hypothetical protein CEK28_03380 [Xenophilus sp. AP218F]